MVAVFNTLCVGGYGPEADLLLPGHDVEDCPGALQEYNARRSSSGVAYNITSRGYPFTPEQGLLPIVLHCSFVCPKIHGFVSLTSALLALVSLAVLRQVSDV